MASCVVWVDRHVHKNGGTSGRYVMSGLSNRGLMFKLGGPSSWSTNLTGWSTFMGNLAEIVEPCSNMQMRLSLELHEAPDMGAHYETRWMEPLRRLREKTGAYCRVVLSTRLRSPADWYVSLYRWGAEPRLKQFNVTLERWASENMQSVLQYWGPVRRSQPLWTLAPAIPNVCLAVAAVQGLEAWQW